MVAPSAVSARIEGVDGRGCAAGSQSPGEFDGCKVDLRDKPADPRPRSTGAKAVGQDGNVALVVADDAREGSATTLVLLDPAGSVIDKMPVTVGG